MSKNNINRDLEQFHEFTDAESANSWAISYYKSWANSLKKIFFKINIFNIKK